MAFDAVYYVSAIDIAGTIISGIMDSNIDPGITEILDSADGIIDPSYAAVGQASPRITFSTTNIAAALGAVGLDGKVIAAGPAGDVIVYLARSLKGGVRAAPASHISATMIEGLIVPRPISADSSGQRATASFEIIPSSVSGADPILFASNATLPTISDAEGFVAGPVRLNNATVNVDAIQSINIDPGITEIVNWASGDVFPTFVGIGKRAPKITISSLDATLLSTYGLTGTAQGETDSVVFLRKVDKNGTRVTDITAEHISFTMDDGMILTRPLGGNTDSEASVDLELVPTYDGTNAVLVISTTAVIS